VLRRRLDRDVDVAVAQLERKAGRLVDELAGRAAGERVVVVAVPGAAKEAVLDRALAQRPALMRTPVVQRRPFALIVDQRDLLETGVNGRDPALGKVVSG
jgi:hypothetical protein